MVTPFSGPRGARVSDIFREIEDELRRDNLLQLWSRYGKYVIAVAVLAVVVAGAIVAWRDHQLPGAAPRARVTRGAGARARRQEYRGGRGICRLGAARR